ADVARLESADGGFETTFVELFKGVPVQAGEATDVADRQQLQQALEPGAHALGQAGGRLQPVNPLGYPPATQAVDTTHRQLQQDALVEQIAITHLTDSPLVDQRAGLGTPAANR